MKYLLISPPKKGVRMFIESPPVGLGYLGTALRKLNHEVEIKDCLVEGWNNRKIVHYINDTHPDVIGINLFSTAIQSVQELTKEISFLNHNPKIILGGPHCTGAPKSIFKLFPKIDYAFKGEGEIAIKEFDEFLAGKRPEEKVKGLIYRNFSDFKISVNENIQYPNIEEFDFPAWDLINPQKYFKEVNVGDKSINVHFSRGCPFSCRFCVNLGKKMRFRSLEHIWAELEMLNKDYGVERFIINDEGYTMFPEFVKKFCSFALSKGNPYRFFTATGLRLNCLDDEMLELMKQANHELVFGVGIESAVPRVREKLMNKRLTQQEVENGLKLLNKHGFKPVGNFIIGFPGETRQELIQTVKWAYKSKWLRGANFVPFLPLPGAQVTEYLLNTGELPPDFDFSKLNLSAVVYAPRGMTLNELDKLRRWAVWKYNSKPKLLWYYISDWDRFKRAVIIFLRIFLPNWLLSKNWRRL